MSTNTLISRHFKWEDVAFTDVGKVRKVNEDSMLSQSDQAHWVVADGMGGHDDGGVASLAITEALSKLKRQREFTQYIDTIEDCIIDVNRYLRELAGDGKVIGSTVVGMALQSGHVVYYWVGDSRIYRFRDHSLEQLSIDHTFLQELVEEGKLDPEAIADHAEKNVITRAVGADEEVFVDFEIDEVRDGDIYMLCSDGVEKVLSDEQVQSIIDVHGADIAASGQEILDKVLDGGSPDNVTLILVEVSRSNKS